MYERNDIIRVLRGLWFLLSFGLMGLWGVWPFDLNTDHTPTRGDRKKNTKERIDIRQLCKRTLTPPACLTKLPTTSRLLASRKPPRPRTSSPTARPSP